MPRLPLKLPKGFKVDGFLVLLIGTVVLASLLPVRGPAAHPADIITDLAIALLFFLHGAKLSRAAVLEGIGAWRIHILVVVATFVMFPILGLLARALSDHWLNPVIGAGVLLLCLMPSTVQSSIAFTSLARGNVPAAVCSASASSILGIVITPVLAGLFLARSGGGFAWDAVLKVTVQLLIPFAAGHLLRPLLLTWLERDRALLAKVDRGVILLVVYTAFSAAVVQGIWKRYSAADLAWTVAIDATILAAALGLTTGAARLLRFSRRDEIVIVFCGSKKSLASGVPLAGALFPAAAVGPMILPLMLFHQLQLLTCAVLAQRYAMAADTRLDLTSDANPTGVLAAGARATPGGSAV
jgi:sodium/bile acid cotransporter 7